MQSALGLSHTFLICKRGMVSPPALGLLKGFHESTHGGPGTEPGTEQVDEQCAQLFPAPNSNTQHLSHWPIRPLVGLSSRNTHPLPPHWPFPLLWLHLHPALSLLQDACNAPPVTTFIESHSPSLTHLEKNPPVVLLWL